MTEAPASRSEIWRQRLRRLRKRARRALPFVSGMIAVLVALWLYSALFPPPHQLDQNDVNNTIASVLASATPPPAFSALVYQAIRPSLVVIDTRPPSNNSNARYNSDSASGDVLTSLDTADNKGVAGGVVVDTAGDILTSLHVVAGAASITVTFADGTQSRAQIVGQQPDNDIAVLQAEQPPAQIIPATLGNPNAMNVGDEAYVVGSPFALYNSMSAGVISGFERTFQLPGSNVTLQHLIQFDAAVNPGNSGGPLLNRSGQVIGIVVGLLNPTDQGVFIGVGFAVTITAAGGAAGLPPD